MYYAAACQTDFPAPTSRSQIAERTRRMIQMAEQAVTGYEPFFDVRLLAFPEFAHAVPIHPTTDDLLEGGFIERGKRTTDAWDNEFKIECNGDNIDVVSNGPDGVPSEDDIR